MQLSREDIDAIAILRCALAAVQNDPAPWEFSSFQAEKTLHNAIRYLAYPDRAVYPKKRHSKKGDPIVRRRVSTNDAR